MAIKPVATTEEEIPIYEQEENLAKLYERREDEYVILLERLAKIRRPYFSSENNSSELALDICAFLLREVQYKKLI